jgi:hypothetical protein
MLCYVMLCYVTLRYVTLRYAVLFYVLMFCTISSFSEKIDNFDFSFMHEIDENKIRVSIFIVEPRYQILLKSVC